MVKSASFMGVSQDAKASASQEEQLCNDFANEKWFMDDGVLHIEGTFKVRAREWMKGSREEIVQVSRPI